MSRHIDPKAINLEIERISLHEFEEHRYLDIHWSADIGFGCYGIELNLDTGALTGDSECMDKGEDKTFLAELLLKFREYILENITVR